MNIDNKAIGKQIRTQRKIKKLSQRNLSDLTDISQNHISRIENGKRSVSIKTIVIIANTLNLSTDTLLNNNVNTEKNNLTVNVNDIQNIFMDCSSQNQLILLSALKSLKYILEKHQ